MTLQSKLDKLLSRGVGVKSNIDTQDKADAYAEYVNRLERIIRAVGPLVEIIEDLNLNCEECDGDSEYDKCTYCLAREALTNFTKAIDQESGG